MSALKIRAAAMRYRTMSTKTFTRLSCERRSIKQVDKFPIEDLNGNIITKDRRVKSNSQAEGVEVTESKISQAEFQEYFEKFKG